MDPRALLRPVGPLPAGVYWRRRFVVLGAALLAVMLLGMATSGGRSSADQRPTSVLGEKTRRPASPAGTATHHPATGRQQAAGHQTAAQHTAPKQPAGHPSVTACRASDLRLGVTTDHTSYAAGALPRFVLTIAGPPGRACRVDVGPAVRAFVVRSGADRVFSTADCPQPGHVTTTLRPGHPIAYALTWNRHRSAAGCAGGQPAALPGTYRVTGQVGSAVSGEAVFVLASR